MGEAALTIKWLGHACFLITLLNGTRVVTDPFDPGMVGYRPPGVAAHIVTVSHQHQDHNAIAMVRGRPHPVQGPGVHRVGGAIIKGVATWHDQSQGRERGPNTVFVIEQGGIRICHLGDLGHLLTPGQLREIGRVDILLIPVGGVYTIDAATASKVVDQLKPKMVVPMHYQTPALKFRLGRVDEFLRGKQGVERLNTDTLKVKAGRLPKVRRIVVLRYAG